MDTMPSSAVLPTLMSECGKLVMVSACLERAGMGSLVTLAACLAAGTFERN